MHRTKPTLIAALIAGLSFGGAAFAADKSAEEKAKSSDTVENPKAAAERGPTDKNYDSVRQENVERAVDPAPEKGAAGQAGVAPKVRDWNAIDKNNDNLIQPEEMDAYLDKYRGRQVGEATK